MNVMIKSEARLTPKEADIMAEFMYHNHIRRDIPEQDRMMILFSYQVRKQIMTSVGTTEDSFRNMISSIRKKGHMTYEGLHKAFMIHPDGENTLTYKFILNGK